jgi:hypothetical protein
MRRVLTLAGRSLAGPCADLVEATGLADEVVDPVAADPERLARGGFDVVFAAGSTGDPPRSWGEAIAAFVEGGGGLVACRPATQWFPDWERWTTFLGARLERRADAERFAVDSTITSVVVQVATGRHGHPLVAGFDATLTVTAPLAGYGAVRSATVLASGAGGAVLWCAARGTGRVVVDALAYDAGSLSVRANRVLLQRALRWVGES